MVLDCLLPLLILKKLLSYLLITSKMIANKMVSVLRLLSKHNVSFFLEYTQYTRMKAWQPIHPCLTKQPYTAGQPASQGSQSHVGDSSPQKSEV